jgi:hypothetical protein
MLFSVSLYSSMFGGSSEHNLSLWSAQLVEKYSRPLVSTVTGLQGDAVEEKPGMLRMHRVRYSKITHIYLF